MKYLRLTVGGPKGGCARSTTAAYLALAAARTRPYRQVHVLDVDPVNTTLSSWAQEAGRHWPTRIHVTACDHSALPALIDQIPANQHLIIDTTSRPSLTTAAALTSTVLLTLAPTRAEMAALTPTLQALAPTVLTTHPTLAVLLTRTLARAVSTRQARTALNTLPLTVLDTEIGHREAIAQAYGHVPHDLDRYPSVLTDLLTLS